jgi:hypothetical protein
MQLQLCPSDGTVYELRTATLISACNLRSSRALATAGRNTPCKQGLHVAWVNVFMSFSVTSRGCHVFGHIITHNHLVTLNKNWRTLCVKMCHEIFWATYILSRCYCDARTIKYSAIHKSPFNIILTPEFCFIASRFNCERHSPVLT